MDSWAFNCHYRQLLGINGHWLRPFRGNQWLFMVIDGYSRAIDSHCLAIAWVGHGQVALETEPAVLDLETLGGALRSVGLPELRHWMEIIKMTKTLIEK